MSRHSQYTRIWPSTTVPAESRPLRTLEIPIGPTSSAWWQNERVPPPDTNVLRLLQSNFLEKDVERGSAGYCDLEVVGEHGDPLEELFDQDPTLVVVRLGPDAREVGRSQLSMNLRCRMPSPQ
jgi:hypothetical protein